MCDSVLPTSHSACKFYSSLQCIWKDAGLLKFESEYSEYSLMSSLVSSTTGTVALSWLLPWWLGPNVNLKALISESNTQETILPHNPTLM